MNLGQLVHSLHTRCGNFHISMALKTQFIEKIVLVGERENAINAQFVGFGQNRVGQAATPTLALQRVVNGERFEFGQTFPARMERAATDDIIIVVHHNRIIADMFVKLGEAARQHMAVFVIFVHARRHLVDERANLLNVRIFGFAKLHNLGFQKAKRTPHQSDAHFN